MCTRGCGPSKYSPEFERRYKPENHAGCCCKGSREEEAPEKKRVVRGCYIRYRVYGRA